MTNQLIIATDGALGRITLNRPEAINALSLPMIEGITAALTSWRDDPEVGAVLFDGAGPKGFCAGGDVRAVRQWVIEGRHDEANAYFAAEYRMNRLIAGFRKPLVALTHGVVMGGGIGIAGHCGFRLTQPGARFAMPESAIGFFADVGVNAILSQTTLNRALLFLLSGVSVGASDALELGLADAVIARDRVLEIVAGLSAAAGSSHPQTAIVRLLEAESIGAGDAPFSGLADLLPAAAPTTPAAFLDAVVGILPLAEIAALLATRSPAALTASFHAQLEARRVMDVDLTLATDLRLARVMVAQPDFAEGVRAVLVDKDLKPTWASASLDDYDPGPILAALASG